MSARKVETTLRRLSEAGQLRLRGRLVWAVVKCGLLLLLIAVLIAYAQEKAPTAWPFGDDTVEFLSAVLGLIGAVGFIGVMFRQAGYALRTLVISSEGVRVLGHRFPWPDILTVRTSNGPDDDGNLRATLDLTPDADKALRRGGRVRRLGLELKEGGMLLLPPVAGLSAGEVATVLQAAQSRYR